MIDDGSTDGSFEYIQREFGGSLAHLSRRGNRGAHATINDAIAQARGEWIAILNSDDVYAPERIARLFEFTSRHNHDLVFSDVSFCDERGPLGHAHKAVQSHARATAAAERGSIEQALLRGNFVLTTSNLMMRKAAFDADRPIPAVSLLSRLGLSVAGDRQRAHRLAARAASELPAARRQHDPRAGSMAPHHGTRAGVCGVPGRAHRSAATDAMSHSDYVLESREFAPIVVSWLLSECRRLGFAAIFRELETGAIASSACAPRSSRISPCRMPVLRCATFRRGSTWGR